MQITCLYVYAICDPLADATVPTSRYPCCAAQVRSLLLAMQTSIHTTHTHTHTHTPLTHRPHTALPPTYRPAARPFHYSAMTFTFPHTPSSCESLALIHSNTCGRSAPPKRSGILSPTIVVRTVSIFANWKRPGEGWRKRRRGRRRGGSSKHHGWENGKRKRRSTPS